VAVGEPDVVEGALAVGEGVSLPVAEAVAVPLPVGVPLGDAVGERLPLSDAEAVMEGLGRGGGRAGAAPAGASGDGGARAGQWAWARRPPCAWASPWASPRGLRSAFPAKAGAWRRRLRRASPLARALASPWAGPVPVPPSQARRLRRFLWHRASGG
jgi:hypothetical protein